jgi:prevent-host-death family protein
MTRVGVARLKAELSEYLRKVKRGKEVVVYDRDTPIARIVPYEPAKQSGRLIVRPAKPGVRFQDIPLPPPLRLADGRSIVDVLIEERQKERERLP